MDYIEKVIHSAEGNLESTLKELEELERNTNDETVSEVCGKLREVIGELKAMK